MNLQSHEDPCKRSSVVLSFMYGFPKIAMARTHESITVTPVQSDYRSTMAEQEFWSRYRLRDLEQMVMDHAAEEC